MLTDHPLWPKLRDAIKVSWDHRTISSGRVRARFFVKEPTGELLGMITDCATCGEPIMPVRRKKAKGAAHVAVTCDLHTNMACARSKCATAAYDGLIEAGGWKP